jgi:predicted Zn-dependent protease
MIKKTMCAIAAVVVLAACEVVPVQTEAQGGTTALSQSYLAKLQQNQAVRRFVHVVEDVEPIAEQECRVRTRRINCNFWIVVDVRPDEPANAYQTLDKWGRPVIVFTLQMIKTAKNADELAFILGHEAAHHISGHIPRQKFNAMAGEVILAGIALLNGGDNAAVQTARRVGADYGARAYSKRYELEADALGTVITAKAGYDPIRGAEFFNRIPDPGDVFLGTHPPNAARIEIVQETAAAL